jgi:hypothetical protein
VPIGARTRKITVYKETLQSSVRTFTNMELEIKVLVIGSPERQRRYPIMVEESIVKK